MKAFPWRAGMRCKTSDGYFGRLLTATTYWHEHWEEVWAVSATEQPDPNDGATKGALLEAVREVYNDPHIGVSYETWIDGQNYWRVGLDYEHPCGRAELGTDPDSEFAALEAAWQAAP